MTNINEIIIVEGKHDIDKVSKVVNGLILKTDGTSLSIDFLNNLLELSKQGKKFIILTDPDYPGTYIRNKILEIIPDCKIAYINKENAKTDKKVGIEHSDIKYIEEALNNLVSLNTKLGNLTMSDLVDLHLSGYENSDYLREKICKKLHLPKSNSKTLLKYLNSLSYNVSDIKGILDE